MTTLYHVTTERILLWLIAWATLAEGLAGVLTVGFWHPGWGFRACVWMAKWECKRRNK